MPERKQSSATLKPLRADYPRTKIAEMLEGTQWANEFTWRQIEKISGYMQVYRAAEGTTVFEEGEPDDSLGIIASGSIDILKSGGKDRSNVLATLGPGNTFGEMSLVDGEPRSALAVASRDAEILMLTKEKFSELSKQTPGLALRILLKISRLLSQRLRKTSGRLVEHLSEHDELYGQDKKS